MGTSKKRKSRYIRLVHKHWRFTLGLVSGNYWIGIRKDFLCDGWEFNLFGLMLIIHNELWEDVELAFTDFWTALKGMFKR